MTQTKTPKIRTAGTFAQSVMASAPSLKNAHSAREAEKAQQAAPSADNAPGRASFDHWWHDEDRRNLRLAGESLETMKAAMTFEGTRRRPEVIAAALAGIVPPDWQHFTGLAVAWSGESWARLFPDQQARLIGAFLDPLYLPPVGLSLSSQPLIPLAEEECREERARELEAAGFVIVAVDCKTRAGITQACKDLMKLPKTYRRADLKTTVQSGQRATPTGFRIAMTAEVEVPKSRRFNCYLIAAELEAWDKRREPSDFMSRIRL